MIPRPPEVLLAHLARGTPATARKSEPYRPLPPHSLHDPVHAFPEPSALAASAPEHTSSQAPRMRSQAVQGSSGAAWCPIASSSTAALCRRPRWMPTTSRSRARSRSSRGGRRRLPQVSAPVHGFVPPCFIMAAAFCVYGSQR